MQPGFVDDTQTCFTESCVLCRTVSSAARLMQAASVSALACILQPLSEFRTTTFNPQGLRTALESPRSFHPGRGERYGSLKVGLSEKETADFWPLPIELENEICARAISDTARTDCTYAYKYIGISA